MEVSIFCHMFWSQSWLRPQDNVLKCRKCWQILFLHGVELSSDVISANFYNGHTIYIQPYRHHTIIVLVQFDRSSMFSIRNLHSGWNCLEVIHLVVVMTHAWHMMCHILALSGHTFQLSGHVHLQLPIRTLTSYLRCDSILSALCLKTAADNYRHALAILLGILHFWIWRELWYETRKESWYEREQQGNIGRFVGFYVSFGNFCQLDSDFMTRFLRIQTTDTGFTVVSLQSCLIDFKNSPHV